MKLLFIRFSSLGDIVLLTGLFPWIKSHFPEAQISVVTKSSFADILKASPHIDHVYPINTDKNIQSLYKDFKKINSHDYTFDLHDNLRSRLLCWTQNSKTFRYKKSSIKRRAFTNYRWFKQSLDRRHITEKYAEVISRALNIPVDNLNQIRPQLLASNKKEELKNSIAIHPFASRATKEWPHVEALCQSLLNKGYKPLIIGQSDKSIKLPEGTLSLINKTSLPEMLNIISSCRALITTDSGPMHISVALNKPTLALFGSSTADFGFSPHNYSGVKILQDKSLSCRPCHVHGLNACPLSHFNCMNNIKAPQIISELQSLLDT